MFSDKPIETLIKGKYPRAEDRWYPYSIDGYKAVFNKMDMTVANSHALKSNLSYSMQYLEYLEKQLSEFELSSVLYAMTVKSYVITGMSILEGLFSNIVRSKGWWKMSSVKSIGTVTSSKKKFEDKYYIIKTELCTEVPQYEIQMNLDDLIKKLENHHDALDVDHLIYPSLRRLKELRNRIHLQKLESETDHDYNAFDFSVKREMGSILYQILTSSMITDFPQYLDFLKTNCPIDEMME